MWSRANSFLVCGASIKNLICWRSAILSKLTFFSPSGVKGFEQQGTRVNILKERAYLGFEKKKMINRSGLGEKRNIISRFRLSSSQLSYLYSQFVASRYSPPIMTVCWGYIVALYPYIVAIYSIMKHYKY